MFGKMRKWEKTLGATQTKYKLFEKRIDVANYSPSDFVFTTDWANYLKNSTKYFCEVIKTTNPDDLCDTMLDAQIESKVREMKSSAYTQLQHHIRVIKRHNDILNGERVKLEGSLAHLRNDLTEIEKELGAIAGGGN